MEVRQHLISGYLDHANLFIINKLIRPPRKQTYRVRLRKNDCGRQFDIPPQRLYNELYFAGERGENS